MDRAELKRELDLHLDDARRMANEAGDPLATVVEYISRAIFTLEALALSAAPAPAPAVEGKVTEDATIEFLNERLAAVTAELDQYKEFHPTPYGVVERLWDVAAAASRVLSRVEDIYRSSDVRVSGDYVARLRVALAGLSGISRPEHSAALTPASPESQA